MVVVLSGLGVLAFRRRRLLARRPANSSGTHLTDQERDAFLKQARYGVLTHLMKDGSPVAVPVWFDRDHESDIKQFNVGLKFLVNAKSQEIKTLSKEACKDEKRFVALWKKFF